MYLYQHGRRNTSSFSSWARTCTGKRLRVGVVAARSPHKQAAERRGARAWRNSTQFRYPLRVKPEFFVLYRDRVSFAVPMQANIWPLKVEILRTTPRCRGEFRCRNIDHRLSTHVVMVILPHLAGWITNNLPIDRRAIPRLWRSWYQILRTVVMSRSTWYRTSGIFLESNPGYLNPITHLTMMESP